MTTHRTDGARERYRLLRRHGFDPVAAVLLALFSAALGQPAGEVSILHYTFTE